MAVVSRNVYFSVENRVSGIVPTGNAALTLDLIGGAAIVTAGDLLNNVAYPLATQSLLFQAIDSDTPNANAWQKDPYEATFDCAGTGAFSVRCHVKTVPAGSSDFATVTVNVAET